MIILEKTYLFFKYQITYSDQFIHINYDVSKFEDIDTFRLKYAFSLDGSNFSNYGDNLEDLIPGGISPDDMPPFYLSILFEPILLNNLQQKSIYLDHNIDDIKPQLKLKSITCNGEEIDLKDKNKIKFETENQIINQYPKWNLYDNHNHSIKRWIAQCNAVAESYGHKCIYFRTVPTEINNTLRQQYEREVISIKKFPIVISNNEIGNIDKLIYSDWDMPLQDDFICHIVWDKFKIAFGDNAIPSEKDYLYLPLLNKMFRVSSVQPITSYMGKVAWYEVNLLKFEKDLSVSISQDLIDESTGFEEVFDLLNTGDLLDISGTELLYQEDGTNTLEQSEKHINNSLNTSEKIGESTVLEKRESNQGYTNRLIDSTKYISLKESEAYREFYDKRLELVQVKPDSEVFQVTMYNNQKVPKNEIALIYNIQDFTLVSKIENNTKTNYNLSFNFVPLNKFNGYIFQINDVYIKYSRQNKLYVNDILVDFELTPNELYNIIFIYDLERKQYIVKINELKNKIKKQLYNDIYLNTIDNDIITINDIQLFGGDFLTGEIFLNINNKEIFKDYCNPLRVSNT